MRPETRRPRRTAARSGNLTARLCFNRANSKPPSPVSLWRRWARRGHPRPPRRWHSDPGLVGQLFFQLFNTRGAFWDIVSNADNGRLSMTPQIAAVRGAVDSCPGNIHGAGIRPAWAGTDHDGDGARGGAFKLRAPLANGRRAATEPGSPLLASRLAPVPSSP